MIAQVANEIPAPHIEWLPILTEVIQAARLLAEQGIDSDVFSVTSWSELARDGQVCEQRALAGDTAPGMPFIARQLAA